MSDSTNEECIYDAILFVSFGGPEGPDDVLPFLENVLRGRNVPRERMLQVAEHYHHFGGVSPINEQNRALISALEEELNHTGPRLPIYFGNRNWKPYLHEAIAQMRDHGVKRAIAFFTSAFSSYSGCRQYRENINEARQLVGADSPEIDKLRVFYNHPGYVQTMQERVEEAWSAWRNERRNRAVILFTAHSIPMAMAAGCNYQRQLLESCRLVAESLKHPKWQLVYQSRSGPASQPWLEPDVNDALRAIKDGNEAEDTVIVPIGFISDHMEVLYDLDCEAKQTCEEIGLNMVRAASAGVHPRFVRMIRELIAERAYQWREKPALGEHGPSHDVCPVDCCLSGRPAGPPR